MTADVTRPWTVVRDAWSCASRTPGVPRPAGSWSQAELAVMASLVGPGDCPTVGQQLASLDDDVLGVTVDVVTRSLVARSHLAAGDDGSAVLDPEIHEWLRTALGPHLVIMIEVQSVSGAAATWIGLNQKIGTMILLERNGSRGCAVLQAHDLVDIVIDITTENAPVDCTPADRRGVSIDELAGDSQRGVRFAQVRTGWRHADVVCGGELTFVVDPAHGVWTADRRGAEWDLRGVDRDGLRLQLLDHLPA